MKHILKLDPEYYEAVKSGIKIIELRLYDEKRRKINKGDTIDFYKQPELKEYITTEVTDIIIEKSFEDILNKFSIEELAGNCVSKEELKSALNRFYSKKEQEELGVIGIKIKLI